jgi:ribosomal protein S18 acetylase RimI-like enzyme
MLIYIQSEIFSKVAIDFSTANCRTVLWKPSLKHFIPQGKSKKYLVYWLFHFLHVFKNRDYSALLIYEKDKLISSLLMVPAYYKWPFMNKNDLQFTYVLTHSSYRGKGIAEKAIRYGISKMTLPGRCFWYVTDSGNTSSINLCTKLGFEYYSTASRSLDLKLFKVEASGSDSTEC